jgi:small subunit ribosomal protein S17
MAEKARVQGIVTSDRMEKSVVVAVERQVRHPLYGKIQRRTSTFLAHNEGNVAKIGDLVEIVEGRPMSRRKRWVVARIVRQALDLKAREAEAQLAAAPEPKPTGGAS